MIIGNNLKNLLFNVKDVSYKFFFIDSKYSTYLEDVNAVFQKNFNEIEVLRDLKNKGFCIIDGFLTNKLTNILNDEFLVMLSKKKNNFDEKVTKTIQVRNCDKSFYLKNKLFLTYILFSNAKVKKLITKILEKNFLFNSEIYFQKTSETNTPLAGNFHYDKRRSIKVWFYVNECNRDCGPLECIEGSHLLNKKIRSEKLLNQSILNKDYNHLKNKNFEGITKLTASAGSLVIFDSDVSHRATSVKSGRERKIIRGATFD